jgi:hypothetical protein
MAFSKPAMVVTGSYFWAKLKALDSPLVRAARNSTTKSTSTSVRPNRSSEKRAVTCPIYTAPSSFSFSSRAREKKTSRAREKKRKKKGQSRREGEDKSRQKDISLSLGLLPFSLLLNHFFPKREEEEDTGEEENRGHGKGIGETTLQEM